MRNEAMQKKTLNFFSFFVKKKKKKAEPLFPNRGAIDYYFCIFIIDYH